MDALGCRNVLRSACDGGVLHRLAALGVRDTGYRDADNAVSCCQCRTRCCSALSRPHWVETANAQPRHITSARKFRTELHTNPTRQLGSCAGSISPRRGRNRPAQGNALGTQEPESDQALSGRHTEPLPASSARPEPAPGTAGRERQVGPFPGRGHPHLPFPGRCLGWPVAAPSGRGTKAQLQNAPARDPRHSPRWRVGLICDLLSCRGNNRTLNVPTCQRPLSRNIMQFS